MLEAGKFYKVSHSRKGSFTIQAHEDDGGDWVTGTIVEGETITQMDYNKKYEGEELTMRRSFCSFEEVSNG